MRGGNNRLNVKAVLSWVKNPQRTPKKLSDGDGLFLKITPAGTPIWLMKYRREAKETLISFGPFPQVSLAEARVKRDAARGLLREHRDPVIQRRVARADATTDAGQTFAELSRAWLTHRRPGWSKSHFKTVSETLDRHVLGHIGPLPISEVSHRLVAQTVKRLGERIDTAQKVRQIIAGVFRFAQAEGKFEGDNPAEAAREVIGRRRLKGRRPAITTLPELGDLLRRARAANLSPAVALAHRLCAFTATRLGNVISARWQHFDLDAGTWTIPRSEMKAQDRHFDHIVFLPLHFVAELRAWSAERGTPREGFVFPSPADADQHITHESVEKVYRVTLRLKDKHTPHGWRAAFSTLARDAGHDRDAVEMALDHIHDNDVARAYDRGDRRELRLKLASWWGEQLANAELSHSLAVLTPDAPS